MMARWAGLGLFAILGSIFFASFSMALTERSVADSPSFWTPEKTIQALELRSHSSSKQIARDIPSYLTQKITSNPFLRLKRMNKVWNPTRVDAVTAEQAMLLQTSTVPTGTPGVDLFHFYITSSDKKWQGFGILTSKPLPSGEYGGDFYGLSTSHFTPFYGTWGDYNVSGTNAGNSFTGQYVFHIDANSGVPSQYFQFVNFAGTNDVITGNIYVFVDQPI